LFVGATIGGAVLTADNTINEAFYKMKAGEVLDKPESVNPPMCRRICVAFQT